MAQTRTGTSTKQAVVRVLDRTGDSTYTYDLDDAAAVAEASRIVDEAIQSHGKLAYTVDAATKEALALTSFNPTATETIITPRLVGG